MRIPRTLRFRLTAWYCCALALMMILLGSMMYGIVKHRRFHRHDGILVDKAARLLPLLQGWQDSTRLTRVQADAMDPFGPIVLAREAAGGYQVYYQSPELRANPIAPRVLALGWADDPAPRFRTLEYQGLTWRVLSVSYQGSDGHRGIIRLAESLGAIEETLRHLRDVMLLLIPAGVVCSALGGIWLSARALAPVAVIARRAQEIELDRLDQRLPHPGVDDEIGRLVDTLNRMIERLEKSFHAMERFTADASHELRNPLATMQNTIEVVLAQARTVDEQRGALESLDEDLGRLRRIVEDLLLLARADNGRLSLEREPVRLDGLVQALVETYQAQAQEQGVAMTVDAPGRAEVSGDERWLCQLVGNLLDNALKFTPPGGRVQVEVLSRPDAVRLSVRDSGPGIPEASLDRVFERFYQADRSRTRTRRPGAGLGLAIAAWIAESHGGRISAANHPDGGALFTVELPPWE
jgi:heavy metal sensor kinase